MERVIFFFLSLVIYLDVGVTWWMTGLKLLSSEVFSQLVVKGPHGK